MPKTNAASRLKTIVLAAQKGNTNHSATDVWANVFGLSGESPTRKTVKVAQKVAALHGQLEAVRAALGRHEISSELYEPQAQVLEQAISLTNLGAPWANYVASLRPDVMLALDWWTQTLDDEETPLTEETLAALRQQIDDLEHTAEDAAIPEPLRQMIQRQCNEMRAALMNYQIMGAKAFTDAAERAVMEMVRHKNEMADFSGEPAVQRFRDLVYEMGSVGETAYKTAVVIEATHTLWKYLLPVVKGP